MRKWKTTNVKCVVNQSEQLAHKSVQENWLGEGKDKTLAGKLCKKF
jgi:hypothetical protein